MIECKELAGKVIRVCHLYEDGVNGPELQIEFTDGTSFVTGLKVEVSFEARYLRSDGGGSTILKDYTQPVIIPH
ncbi:MULTISPECIES: hypothetical protein [Acidobacteriaceae]|uniref:Uncharacterized protein n=1 Tax=Granulicella sibirica TaxID=2479048 RepID=A0A4Q0SUN9_9BACT|nr:MULTISPECIES: hypothetical protein [Acidobacteriaceae]RXH54447.1 hypothetical protein GRAN_4743 [Granulicella sibirica]